jgi:xanthine/CO dehydrogenase XdhC/CoxF family maturation factor
MGFLSFQPTPTADLSAERSYAFGQTCGEAIELLLCAVERLAPHTSAFDRCCMAEAIIEHMDGRPSDTSWDDVTAGVRATAPRFRAAELESV